jgi:hypothetical protein
MSGYYNYHPTIEHPGDFRVQTASQQPPFYFGGSQVLVNLVPEKLASQSIKGEGIHKSFNSKIFRHKGLTSIKR